MTKRFLDVVIFGAPPPPPEAVERINSKVAPLCRVTFTSVNNPDFPALQRATILFTWGKAGPFLQAQFGMLENLRWIQSANAGIEDLIFPELVSSNVTLTNCRGLYSEPVAEYALALLLAMLVRLPEVVLNSSNRLWSRLSHAGLKGSTVGIVGYGSIGEAIARRLLGFGVRILALRRGGAAVREHTVQVVRDLPALLEESDCVIIATPLTPQTKGLIGREAFGHMRHGAILINIARGGVVDEDALADSLNSGRLRAAASDVFLHEPLPSISLLYGIPNLLVSPHMGGAVGWWAEAAVDLFTRNLLRFLNDEPLESIVSKERGY